MSGALARAQLPRFRAWLGWPGGRGCLLPRLGSLLLLGGCLDIGDPASLSGSSALAASGGGVMVDVVTTNVWSGGFNGAVRISSSSFPAPISSFAVVFRLSGNNSIGSAWNGNISGADGAGNRTATSPSWLPHSPIRMGQSWEVGFTAGGSFAGAEISGLTVNGQTIPIDDGDGGGDDGGGDDGGGDDGGGDDGGGDGGDGDGGGDGGDGGDGGNPGKFVGNITTSGMVRSDFIQYWNQITPENEGKWGTVEATRDVMNWAGLDAVYNYARQHGIPFKQHTLIWGSQQPGWIAGLPPAEQAAEVEEWIQAFCARYPEVDLIDVVNEPPPHTTPSYMNAIGGAGASGFDWIIWSFQKTRQYCPNAILILNDFNVLRWDTDRFVGIVNAVKGSGFVDAIGAQAHGLETQSFAELQTNLNKVRATGLPIYISEYDIDVADDTAQRNIMAQQFSLFWNTDEIAGITLWGYIHGSTWRPQTGLIRNGVQRPAMTWLMDFLGSADGR